MRSFSVLSRYHCSPFIVSTLTVTPCSHYHNHREIALVKNMSGHSASAASADGSVISKFHQVFHSNSTNGWDKCWEEGLTPWDLGAPTPILTRLHSNGSLPNGRALVPGCGSGHDVVAIACPDRHVVGVDISDNAMTKAKQLFARSRKAEHFTFLKTDFFTWSPDQLFDLIFDYTFFCAIEPKLRSLWARKMYDLLKPDGELITLMFPIDDHEGGPPYKVSVSDYEEVLRPLGFKATEIVNNELAVAPRMGREKLGRWKKFVIQSSL